MKKHISSPDDVYFLKVDEEGISILTYSIHLKSSSSADRRGRCTHFSEHRELSYA